MVANTSLAYLVASNCVPSQEEAERAHCVITDTIEEVRRVNNEIAKLERRRKELEEHIHAHERVVSPWRRLLPELVIEIMRYCDTGKLLPSQHAEFENPFTVSQICSLWRRIAQSAPSLWSSVHIVASSLSTESQARALEILFQRSYPHLLSLDVEYQPLQLQNSGAALRIIHAVRGFSKRWHSLDIRLTDYLLEGLMDGLQPSTDLSNLESLVLRNTWIYSPYPPPITHESLPRGITFRNAPALRNLTLFNTYLNTSTIIECFPLEQLTVLDIFVGRINRPTQFSGVHMANLLTYCPKLQTFRLSSTPESCPLDEYPDPVKPVVVPCLHTLELQAYDRWNCIFDNLVLPNLQQMQLEVSWSSWSNRWSDVPFGSLLERSHRAKITDEVDTNRCGVCIYRCSVGPKLY